VPSSTASSPTSTVALADPPVACADPAYTRAEDGTCVPPGYYDTPTTKPATCDPGWTLSSITVECDPAWTPPTTVPPAPSIGELPQTGAGYIEQGTLILGFLFVWCGAMVVLAARRRGGVS
jgi:hypothetical protein